MPDAREGAGTEEAEDGVVVVALDDDEGPDDNDDAREIVVDVWTCNLTAIRVFDLCTVRGIGAGMGDVWWQGIEIAEIRSACELLKLPRKQWEGVTWDVRYMGRCVASVRNQRASEQAQRKRGKGSA